MSQPNKILEQIDELEPEARDKLVLELLERMSSTSASSDWIQRHYVEEYPLIVATPNVCGGAARLIRTRIPVWTLERMRQLGLSESEILRSYPTLKALDLVQAWAYVARHREEIDQTIRENEAFEQTPELHA